MPRDPQDAPDSSPTLYCYRFEDAEFNEASLQLTVAGRAVEVQRKPLEVLSLLLRHVGEVVTKEELLDTVWVGMLPVENVVANAINKLRAALGAGAGSRVVTQPRVGYRLQGPVERVAVGRHLPSALELLPGKPIPQRPDFMLQEMIGQTHASEVWIGAHGRTGERRVFKFSRSEAGLRALKREATLQRYLGSVLGPRDDMVQLIAANFGHAPFFLETGHGGDDLLRWADRPEQPLAGLTPSERLELAIQICAAVAAAHSVGVLHKDLKPANVLIRPAEGTRGWRVALADFGSALLTHPDRLHALGITELGTTLRDQADPHALTLLYAAPELLAGSPATTGSDVYALGILLFQIAVADLHRPLHSAWQRDIPDELLRMDIAEATDGDPAQRLSGAAALLERLVRMDARRQELALRRAEEGRQIQALAQIQRNRARRPWIVALGVALSLGLLASLAFYGDARRAANDARRQAARADEITRFLNEDILSAAAPGEPGAPANPQMLDVLRAAREKLDLGLERDPGMRASIRLALGKAYAALSDLTDSEASLRAVQDDLAEADPGDSTRLQAQYERVKVLVEMGRNADALHTLETADRAAGERLKESGPVALQSLTAHADYLHGLGRHAEALIEYLRADVLHAWIAPGDEIGLARLRIYEADSLYFTNHFQESVRTVRPLRQMDHALERIGARYWGLAGAIEGRSLADGGHAREGETVLTDALTVMQAHVGARNLFTLEVENELGNLKILLGRLDQALPLYRDAFDAMRERFGADSVGALTAEANLGEVELMAGSARKALDYLQQSNTGIARVAGPGFPQLQEIRLMLAEALLETGRAAEAWSMLDSLDRKVEVVEGVWGPFDARIDALKGQILHALGHRAEGRQLLGSAIGRMVAAHAADTVVERYRAKLNRLTS